VQWEASASISHADVDDNVDVMDGDATGRCGTPEHAGTTPDGDADIDMDAEDALEIGPVCPRHDVRPRNRTCASLA
jgi:hypothetical protein